MPNINTARGVKSSKPDARKRTAAQKKQDHIDAVVNQTTESLPPVIEESIQNSIDDYANRDDPQAKQSDLIEKFRSLIPRPTFDDVWTERDEQNLTQEAERVSEFQHRCTYQDHIASVWKTAYKFMGCLATDIVGPKAYLRFHSDHVTSENRFWAAPFCQKLSSLIVQPIFTGRAEKLALAMQWTVICRTKDRRKWRLSGCGSDDPFLKILKAMVERNQDGTKGPKTLRRLALDVYKRRHPTDGSQDPIWSQFLQRIEEQAPKKKTPAEQERDSQDFGDFELYRVSTTDLNNILEAIVRVRMSGFPMFPDPTTVSMTALYTRNPTDLPQKPQVAEATKAVLLSHRREAKRAEKLGMLEDRGSLAPSQSAAAEGAMADEQGSSLGADSEISDGENAQAEAAVLEDADEAEGSEEAGDEAESEEEEEPVPRRSSRQKGKKKISTLVLSTSSDQDGDGDDDDFSFTSQSPTRPRKGFEKGELFVSIRTKDTPSSRAADNADDDGFQDFGEVELGEIDHNPVTLSDGADTGSFSKRAAETQPDEVSPSASKRRRLEDVLNWEVASLQPERGPRSVVEDSDPGQEKRQEQEQVQAQEPHHFSTAMPYQEARVGHATPLVFPSVPSHLGLGDALKQIFGEERAAGGSQQHSGPAGIAPVDPFQEELTQPGLAAQTDVATPTAAEPSAEAQENAPDQTPKTVKPKINKRIKFSLMNKQDWLSESE